MSKDAQLVMRECQFHLPTTTLGEWLTAQWRPEGQNAFVIVPDVANGGELQVYACYRGVVIGSDCKVVELSPDTVISPLKIPQLAAGGWMREYMERKEEKDEI